MEKITNRWAVGAGLLILFGLFQSLGSWALRECRAEVPALQLLFLQSGGALVLLSPWLLREGWRGLQTSRALAHVLRGWVVLSALSCLLFTLGRIPLGTAVLLSNTAPIWVPFLIWLIRRRVPHISIWASALVGFFGIFLVLHPQTNGWNLVSIVGLLGGLLMGLSYVQVELLGTSEPASRIIFYTLSTLFLSLLPFVLSNWSPMSIGCWWLSGAAAVALSCTSICLIVGFLMGPPAELGPFTYFSVVFAYLWGVLFYSEDLSLVQACGIVLVVAAGSVAMHWRDKGKEAPKEPPLGH